LHTTSLWHFFRKLKLNSYPETRLTTLMPFVLGFPTFQLQYSSTCKKAPYTDWRLEKTQTCGSSGGDLVEKHVALRLYMFFPGWRHFEVHRPCCPKCRPLRQLKCFVASNCWRGKDINPTTTNTPTINLLSFSPATHWFTAGIPCSSA